MDPILFLKIKIKMKQKQKNIEIVNYIPYSLLSKLKERTFDLENLKLDSSYRKEDTILFFIFRSIVFLSFGYDPQKEFDFIELKNFLCSVRGELYCFRVKGYVSVENMESNRLFNIFRSFYPKYKNVFNRIENHSNFNELEHYHNLLILLLLYELEKTLLKILNREEIDDLKTERSLLTKTLSGGIRVSLSKNRLVQLNKKYIAFDTEYTNVDSMTNELLCYTTASVSETIIKIRSPEVDFSLSPGQSQIPMTAPLITIVIKLLRSIRGKKDFELNQLESRLSLIPSLKRMSLQNKDVIFTNLVEYNKIESHFIDLRLDTSQFSFKKLLKKELETPEENSLEKNSVFEVINELKLKPTLKNECVLLAHFTTADVSLFSDFEEIKNKFTVISKSFLTLDKYLTFNHWRVFLRDTSLLSPTGMSLKAIGKLYPHLNLEKIELSQTELSDMAKFFVSNPEYFKKYAMQDAKIVLYHALEVQNSHYFFSKKYTIPVTLSSLASSYLETELLSEGKYHPPTQNGLISMRNIPKILTPSGVELSGDLHEYLDYFLGSYHGGRNESYLYGIVKGDFYDYDLPGAYPTAMAMLDYPD